MKFKPLKPWVKGNGSVTPCNFYGNLTPSVERGAFIALDEAIDLHIADSIDTGNLYDSWHANQNYIDMACAIANVGHDNDFDLDNEEKSWILDELGEPPDSSYNLYFITVYDESYEKIVYIGKTDAKKSRFTNGHKAALKLHNPVYRQYDKRVYFGTITFISNENDYLPLEFIKPYKQAKEYLSEMEALLITYFRPELNKRKEHYDKLTNLVIHIQNFSGESEFLHDYFVMGV